MAARDGADHAHTVTRIFPRLGRVRLSEGIVRALRASPTHPYSLGTALPTQRMP